MLTENIHGREINVVSLEFVYDCFGSDAHRAAHLEEMLQCGMQTINLSVTPG